MLYYIKLLSSTSEYGAYETISQKKKEPQKTFKPQRKQLGADIGA